MYDQLSDRPEHIKPPLLKKARLLPLESSVFCQLTNFSKQISVMFLRTLLSLILFASVAFGSFGSEEDTHTNNKQMYEEMSWRALIGMNKASNDQYHWIPIRILNVRQQLVGGVKYLLKVLVARSNCTKKLTEHSEIRESGCAASNDAKHQICKFEVLSREWEGVEDIIHKGCAEHENAVDTSDQVAGNRNAKSLHDRHVKSDKLKMGKSKDLRLGLKPSDLGAWNLFSGFMDKYNRTYNSKNELLKRFRIYKQNMRKSKMYQLHEKGSAIYGETRFSDLSQEEFKKIMLPYIWSRDESAIHIQKFHSPIDAVPESFDWRQHNVVSKVKNQGACGSCWAFSVTGNIESAWAIKTGKLVTLSEQELVDCDVIDHGCNGGLPLNAYKEIVRMGGLESEDDYPYSGHNRQCQLVKKEIAVYINDSIELPHDELQMVSWLATKGPISIGKLFN